MVSQRDGRLRAFLADFGLTGKSGGTPIFMAPEGLDNDSRIIGKTDLYSFAVTVLFLMFPADLAIKILFLPIAENLVCLKLSLSRFPLLLWIITSILTDPEKRIDFDSWKVLFQKLKSVEKNWLRKKMTSEILEQNGVDFGPLNKSLEKEGDLFFYILENFGYDIIIRSSQVNENEAYKMSTAISQVQNLSLLQSIAEIGIPNHMISKG